MGLFLCSGWEFIVVGTLKLRSAFVFLFVCSLQYAVDL